MEQRVPVTAGASDIGFEIAGASAAKVFVCDIDTKALEIGREAMAAIHQKTS